MNIRPLATAAFVVVWFLAGCLAPTPSIPTLTPVPIATWVAQGIPSDLEITYSYIEGPWFGEKLRITADGSTTYTSYGEHPGKIEGKLSPEALRRIILAFEDKRFFYLAEGGGCVAESASPPTSFKSRSPGSYETGQPVRSVSIRINGISKELTRDERYFCSAFDYKYKGDTNYMSLASMLRASLGHLTFVTPTQTGTVGPGPTATPTGPGG